MKEKLYLHLAQTLDIALVVGGSILSIALVIGCIIGVYLIAAKCLFERNKIFRATLTDVFEKHNDDIPSILLSEKPNSIRSDSARTNSSKISREERQASYSHPSQKSSLHQRKK